METQGLLAAASKELKVLPAEVRARFLDCLTVGGGEDMQSDSFLKSQKGDTMQQASDLRIETLANCRVRVSIRSGNSSSEFEFASQQGSEIAARILNAARRSFAESGKPNPTTHETYWTAVPTSAVGL